MVEWVTIDQIFLQTDFLFEEYQIDVVKIGLIENLDVLDKMLDYLLNKNPKIKIVWDPILKTSASKTKSPASVVGSQTTPIHRAATSGLPDWQGFQFHKEIDEKMLIKVCQKIYLITPNWEEMEVLFYNKKAENAAAILSQHCAVYLKGGHNPTAVAVDQLYYESSTFLFKPEKISLATKHGSGCVLSAAISANLALGFDLKKACLLAKKYISQFFESNDSNLGYHSAI
jgi:hydroxymethylpyrimidine/phosphomethylpyrimidine kinase